MVGTIGFGVAGADVGWGRGRARLRTVGEDEAAGPDGGGDRTRESTAAAASSAALAAAVYTASAAALLALRPLVSAESGSLGGVERDSLDCDATRYVVPIDEVESIDVAGDLARRTIVV